MHTVRSVVPSSYMTSHELTSVGVAFDRTGTMLASGDMVGKVWITERGKIFPLHEVSVSSCLESDV